METYEARETVQAWEEAVNTRNLPRVLHCSDPDIELIGPKGVAKGHDALANWLTQVGVSLDTQRCFASGHAVVHAQLAYWHDQQTGEVVSERPVSTHYRVQEGRVALVARYDELQEALTQAGLSEADEVE